MPKITHVLAAFAAASMLAGGASAQPGSPKLIEVQLYEYSYMPAEIDLDHGQSYVFRLTNTGNKAHDLSAKDFFASVALAPDSQGKVQNGDVEVDKGQTTDVAFTAGAPGTYEMHCSHFMHSMLGMKGKIVVR